jgi:AcrR family transcriptional regulator
MSFSPQEIDARRLAARRQELVERILPVVEEMLELGGGYRNITVDQIARRAGMARSSFYRYFSDKHELLIALSGPARDAIRATALRPLQNGAELTRERLTEELLRTMEDYRPHVPLLGAILEASAYDASAREGFTAGFDQIRGDVAVELARGQREGYIHADLPVSETAGWLTWMAERGMSELVAHADANTLARLAESLAALVWRSIYIDPRDRA